MAVFRDDAPVKLSLSVKILAIDIPSFGASMTTKTIARYELIDRATGIVYTQDVSASGEVPFNYAFAGVIRARESISRSAQNNIAQFLQALETVDITSRCSPTSRKRRETPVADRFGGGNADGLHPTCAPTVTPSARWDRSTARWAVRSSTFARSVSTVRREAGRCRRCGWRGGRLTIGGSDQAAAIGAIGDLVAGAIAGAASERALSQARAWVRGADGERQSMTVVQGPDPVFSTGTRVLVLYGSPRGSLPIRVNQLLRSTRDAPPARGIAPAARVVSFNPSVLRASARRIRPGMRRRSGTGSVFNPGNRLPCFHGRDRFLPLAHGQQHRHQRAAELGQLVFHLRRHFRVHVADHNAICFQFTQLAGEHGLGGIGHRRVSSMKRRLPVIR